MISNSIKSSAFLIMLLVVTPFIMMLGQNSMQMEFIGSNFFVLCFFYFAVFFVLFLVGLYFFKNRGINFVLFLAFLSFYQFYFTFFNNCFTFFLNIFTDSDIRLYAGYLAIIFILFLSFISTLASRWVSFKTFVSIFLGVHVLIAIYNLIPAVKFYYEELTSSSNFHDEASDNSISSASKLPNIFYIVPDGLTSPKNLKDTYDISFEHTLGKFKNKGFSVAEHIFSSYNTTHLSLAALFNMNYQVTEKSKKYLNRAKFYPLIREQNPLLTRFLKKNNYNFVIFPPQWGGCPRSVTYACIKGIPNSTSFHNNGFLVGLDNLLHDYAVSNMIKNSLIHRVIERSGLLKFNDIDDSGKTALEYMKKNTSHWERGGVFTLVHMMTPHTPYRDKDCSILSIQKYDDQIEKNRAYSSSVFCALKRIEELSDSIIKNFPNAIIIVQADHGVGIKGFSGDFAKVKKIDIDRRMGIFSAVRGCNSEEASKLNQAHIIRFIVDCLKEKKLSKKYINKSFFGFYEDSPDFGRVYPLQQN